MIRRRDFLKGLCGGGAAALTAMGAVTGAKAQGLQTVVFATPINLVTVPTNSQPIQNIGQSMHLLQVAFHTTLAQSGFDVVLEWSRDGVNWRPAGPSVTSAPSLSYGVGDNDVIAYAAYYGVFRAIRVAANYTGAVQLDVRYTGQIFPVYPFVTLTGNRWVF